MEQGNRTRFLGLAACLILGALLVGASVLAEGPCPVVASADCDTSFPETTSWGYLPIPRGSIGEPLSTEPTQVYAYLIDATEEQVREFYEREMGVDGWTYVGDGVVDEGVQWLYLRDEAASAVTVTPLQEHSCLFVRLAFADHLPGEEMD